jgi:hypothetical protein
MPEIKSDTKCRPRETCHCERGRSDRAKQSERVFINEHTHKDTFRLLRLLSRDKRLAITDIYALLPAAAPNHRLLGASDRKRSGDPIAHKKDRMRQDGAFRHPGTPVGMVKRHDFTSFDPGACHQRKTE